MEEAYRDDRKREWFNCRCRIGQPRSIASDIVEMLSLGMSLEEIFTVYPVTDNDWIAFNSNLIGTLKMNGIALTDNEVKG